MQCFVYAMLGEWLAWEGKGERVQREHLVDVRQVHLQTMFRLVDFARHDLEIPLRLDGSHERRVDDQVPEGRRVRVAGRGRRTGEVVVV
jgi:hypothetical protein